MVPAIPIIRGKEIKCVTYELNADGFGRLFAKQFNRLWVQDQPVGKVGLNPRRYFIMTLRLAQFSPEEADLLVFAGDNLFQPLDLCFVIPTQSVLLQLDSILICFLTRDLLL